MFFLDLSAARVDSLVLVPRGSYFAHPCIHDNSAGCGFVVVTPVKHGAPVADVAEPIAA